MFSFTGFMRLVVVAASVSLLQDAVSDTQYIHPSPRVSCFQSPLMSIYGTALRKSLVYSNSPDPYGSGLSEKTG